MKLAAFLFTCWSGWFLLQMLKHGWGIEPQSWLWIIGGTLASICLSALARHCWRK